MKAFFAAALAVAASAQDASASQAGYLQQHYELNDTYDHADKSHMHYGGDQPASPAFPAVPKLSQAVDEFDTYGTLFGEHRYQLQVMKTANMMIGTEALREAIAALEDRIANAREYVKANDRQIDVNDKEIEKNVAQINENRSRLNVLDSKLSYLEVGFDELFHKLAVDRDTLIMLCHQYAYSSTIPDECGPMIGNLKGPVDFKWYFPQEDCPLDPKLPPFEHTMPNYLEQQPAEQH